MLSSWAGWLRGRGGTAALVVAWYACSAAGNVVGKLALTEFPFPATMAMVQLGSTALLSGPALWAARVRPARLPREQWRCVLALAVAKFLTALCSQVSLWRVPVSYAHTVKATTPLWTAALGRLLLGRRVSRRVARALAALAAGVALASLSELQFEPLGLGAALAAAALLALQHLYSARLLSARVPPLRLLQLLSGAALLLFLPLWAWRDLAAVAAWPAAPRTLALVAADGALAWLQAAAAFSVLARVSPLSYGVASALKRVVTVGASLLALRNPAPPANLAGMALTAAAALAYDRARQADKRDADGARRPLPV